MGANQGTLYFSLDRIRTMSPYSRPVDAISKQAGEQVSHQRERKGTGLIVLSDTLMMVSLQMLPQQIFPVIVSVGSADRRMDVLPCRAFAFE